MSDSLDPMDHSPPGSSAHAISKQGYWSRLPYPPPGDLPNSKTEPTSLMPPALAGGFFTTSTSDVLLKPSRNNYCGFAHLDKQFIALPKVSCRRRRMKVVAHRTVPKSISKNCRANRDAWLKLTCLILC